MSAVTSTKSTRSLRASKGGTREGAGMSRLFLEIERYLAAVECFRRLGCEPHWRA